jgi:methylated-DNA-protein-cysteine methyltransferase-like protein
MKGSKRNNTPLKKALPSGQAENDFFNQVWELVRQIPKGRVSSYGAIAAALGAKSGARMVGWAMNSSHGQIPPVPAHRVVNRMGQLSGKNHFSSPTQMQELLEKEKIKVINDEIIDFEKLFWDPLKEL